eukprot:CAMPEP_0115182058 /NCGR_PEP_ID=MMETSP0270-20121206/7749_1 /TAXON_ID=71861 /ORGANISM="Scrippsiella trochoidea, Strain CCMP3099" /LENGTH=199 /DNA_ID=CAMNT_0002595097 /DNA_START=64 /DNA_END=663 /DNA_ORIENTATION=+
MSSGAHAFEVVFIKKGAFGLRVDELEGLGKLRVNAVQQHGCVAKFNQALPDSAIRTGDIISSINGGEATVVALSSACEGQEIQLTISREFQQAAPQSQVMGAEECGEGRDMAPQPMPAPMVMGQVITAVGTGGLPAGVPPNSRSEHEKYIGTNTMLFAVGGCLCCGPCACCILLCPLDERNVYSAPDGRKFTEFGAMIL